MSLTFLGAAGTVTGSKHLLDVGGRRVLVDCGLFQGLKELRLRNWAPLPVDPASIDAVVLTHAHLDHCGYLPRLVSAGFRGRVFCTPATKELCSLVLPDSAHIQEEDAREANRHGFTKHHPALPLYTSVDAARALERLQPVGYERPVPLLASRNATGAGSATGTRSGPLDLEITVEFINAGHLLGSAYARIHVGDRTLLFGGDLGRYGRPVLPDPSPAGEADALLVESTYGDRLHPPDDDGERLATIVHEAVARGGKLIVPSFAIGRVEEVLYWLKRLEEENRIPVLPVFIDSPMAVAALQFYSARLHELDAAIATGLISDTNPIAAGLPSDRNRTANGSRSAGLRKVAAFATQRMTVVASPQQSADLIASRQPAIIIAASGMATGGRVLRHLAATISDARNTVMFVGYQAAGTRGRRLVDGEREIKLLGRTFPVAARIERIDSMSAHADAGEILRWLATFPRPPRMTYLVHGEPAALDALSRRINAELGWPVHIAVHQERVDVPS